MSFIRFVRPTAAAVAAAVILAPGTAFADDIASQWIAKVLGSWNVAGNWAPAGVPNNGGGNTYSPAIASAAEVTVDTSVTVANLTLGEQATVRIVNGRTLSLAGGLGDVSNAGLILVDGAAAATNFDVASTLVTLSGGGEVRLMSPTSWIRRSGAGVALLNVDNVIRGTGNLGWSGSPLAVTNQHIVRADGSTPLIVSPAGATLTNTGSLEATDGATLQLAGGTYLNDDGIIQALADSVVALNGDAAITGGLLKAHEGGEIAVVGNTPSLESVAIEGLFRVTNGRLLLTSGTIENRGEIRIDAVGGSTYLRPSGGETSLTGGGSVVLANAANAWIHRQNAGASLRNVDNVIRGTGNLGWSGSPTPFVNEHVVRADQPTPLNVTPGGTVFTNTGSLEATDGATLQLAGGTYVNDGGVIQAFPDSVVALNGDAAITGGLLKAHDGGEIAVVGNTPSLESVAIEGLLRVTNGRLLLTSGTIENRGEIRIDAVGGSTYLRPSGGETSLTGGGSVVLASAANAWVYRQNAGAFLRNVDNVIRGTGNLGWSGSPTPFVNEHVVRADQPTPLLITPTGATFTNTGSLEAVDGATLRLAAGPYINDSGIIQAFEGSRVHLESGAVITGGLLKAHRGAEVVAASGTTRIESLTVEGLLRIDNGHALLASGTIENLGEIRIDSTGGSTYFRPTAGEVSLTGGGTMVLTSATNSWLYKQDGAGFLRNVDNLIRGAGNLGWTGSPTAILNEGAILADAGTLRIAPDGAVGFVNEGSLAAEDAGSIEIIGGQMNQKGLVGVAPGRTLSRSGGHYLQTAGLTTVRGALSVSGSGNQVRIEGGTLQGDGSVTGPVQNIAGVVAPGLSVGTLTLGGAYTQGASGALAIEIDGPDPAEHDRLSIGGAAQLGGLLQPLFAKGYAPLVGTEWTVLTAGSLSGSFAGTLPCERIRLVYTNNSVRIVYTGVLKIGDLNCDGLVNAADLAILLGAWGTDDPVADLNGDGTVGAADLAMLLGGWD